MLKKHKYQWFFYFPRKILLVLIKFYQKTLSPDHGLLKFKHPFGYCRFQPTCSNYAIDAIKKYGILKGLFRAVWRILRCNPWSKGGYDPVK